MFGGVSGESIVLLLGDGGGTGIPLSAGGTDGVMVQCWLVGIIAAIQARVITEWHY